VKRSIPQGKKRLLWPCNRKDKNPYLILLSNVSAQLLLSLPLLLCGQVAHDRKKPTACKRAQSKETGWNNVLPVAACELAGSTVGKAMQQVMPSPFSRLKGPIFHQINVVCSVYIVNPIHTSSFDGLTSYSYFLLIVYFFLSQVWMIDVSQSVEPSHPHALEFLLRDCTNVSKFFDNAGLADVPTPQQLFNEVSG